MKIQLPYKKILILGGKGALALQLQIVLPKAVSWDRDELDVTSFTEVNSKISAFAPSVVINCAAYNNVDQAESYKKKAFNLNARAPKFLARVCKKLAIPLVHFSTGYVFNGTKQFYAEDDSPSPISIYAQSKADGEKNIVEFGGDYYIIRTNALFGPKGQSKTSKPSFVDIMLNVAKKTNTIKAVADEINSITYTPDLAKATKELLFSGRPYGIYHITNEGFASWYEFAKEIFSQLKFKITDEPQTNAMEREKRMALLAVTGKEFPRSARRPKRIVLLNNKFTLLRPWQTALKEYLLNKPVGV